MIKNIKPRFWKLFRWLLILFAVLFLFRLIYGFVVKDTASYRENSSNNFFGNLESVRKNYASEKFKSSKPNPDLSTPANISSNQKFEKTATIKSKSSEFEKDEKLIKAKTSAYQAVIQYEQNLGLKGNRQIHLLIGVNPELFDSFYLEMIKIGTINAKKITKVDKTNEYKQLNAKKISLEKSLLSLNELKNKGGQVADFIELNAKILETEERLQELGVELGNFDTENEFCTVKLLLYEGSVEKQISLLHRIKVALEWTLPLYFTLISSLLCLSILVFVLLLIVDKLKLLQLINKQ